MSQSGTDRSFAVPVFFLLAGLLLGFLAIMWLALGTGPFIDDELPFDDENARPWLPAAAGLLSIAALWWGVRKLRQPAP